MPDDTAAGLNGADVALGVPEGDAVEQSAGLLDDADDDDLRDGARGVPLDVNEADAAEQSRVVPTDEDDYR